MTTSSSPTLLLLLYDLIRNANWRELLTQLPNANKEQINYQDEWNRNLLHMSCMKRAPLVIIITLIDDFGFDVNGKNKVRVIINRYILQAVKKLTHV
jgi:hypothetical protein